MTFGFPGARGCLSEIVNEAVGYHDVKYHTKTKPIMPNEKLIRRTQRTLCPVSPALASVVALTIGLSGSAGDDMPGAYFRVPREDGESLAVARVTAWIMRDKMPLRDRLVPVALLAAVLGLLVMVDWLSSWWLVGRWVPEAFEAMPDAALAAR